MTCTVSTRISVVRKPGRLEPGWPALVVMGRTSAEQESSGAEDEGAKHRARSGLTQAAVPRPHPKRGS